MTRGQQLLVVAAIVAILAALGVGWYARRPSAAPDASGGVYVAPDAPPRAPTVMVHVAGAVARPGVYELPVGSRVGHGIEAAGGFTAYANTDGVNLAATLEDGQRVDVPTRGSVQAPAQQPDQPDSAGAININRASAADLEQLPGIGPSLAARIVQYRATHGPFGSVDELVEVPGIGPGRLADIRGHVVVQ